MKWELKLIKNLSFPVLPRVPTPQAACFPPTSPVPPLFTALQSQWLLCSSSNAPGMPWPYTLQALAFSFLELSSKLPRGWPLFLEASFLGGGLGLSLRIQSSPYTSHILAPCFALPRAMLSADGLWNLLYYIIAFLFPFQNGSFLGPGISVCFTDITQIPTWSIAWQHGVGAQ